MEKPAEAVRQPDGALALERKPDEKARPRQQLPRGAKLERVVQATVAPTAPAQEAGKPCPPVTLDLSLVRDPDGGRRVLASSPDGRVTGGIDIPTEPILMPRERKWAAGLSGGLADQTLGVWVDRDFKLLGLPMRASVEMMQGEAGQTDLLGMRIRGRIGVAF